MPIPRPRIDVPPPAWFAPAMRAVGMPEPSAITALAPAWVHANYRLTFPQGSGVPDVMVRRPLYSPGYDTLQHELAALTLVSALDLPVVKRYRLMPRGSLPWPAAMSQILPGVHGMRVMQRHPELAPAVCRTVGTCMRTLADARFSQFGTGADTGRFVPLRRTWQEEWTALAAEWLGACRGCGTDLGGLTDWLEVRIETRLDALGRVSEFAVVHGDLHPSNLLFLRPEAGSSTPPLSGVVDWEGAILGDPLCEWAVCLELPAETLGHVVEGYGRDAVEAWLRDEGAVSRLEVYTWTRALRRMAFCGGSLFLGDGGRRRSYGLEYARIVTEEALREGTVAERLRAALKLRTSGRIVERVPSAPAHRVLWRALEALRFRPPLRRVHALAYAGALAAGLLAAEEPPENQRGGWTEIGDRLADGLGEQVQPGYSEPIPDAAAWMAALQGEVVSRARTSADSTALLVWCLTRRSLDRLSVAGTWPVNGHVARGAESLIRAVMATDQPGTDGRPRIHHPWLAWAAARALGEAELEVAMRERALDALPDLEDGERASLREIGAASSETAATPDPYGPLLAWARRVLAAEWPD